MSLDQAASLRAWALEKARGNQQAEGAGPRARTGHALVVAGLPGIGVQRGNLVIERLERWSGRGFRWVGDPQQWQVIALGEDAASGGGQAGGCKRWALWVDTDIRAFEKAYESLKQLHALGAPQRILALHEPGIGRKGLLDNLERVAKSYFDIDLVILAS